MSVDTLWDSIEAYLGAEGVELDDLHWAGRVLRVTVDAEGGIDVDRVAELSRGLSRMLDDDPTLADSYTLEVGSPGLERPLRRPNHFRKAIGREVAVTTEAAVAGETHHRGVLTAYTEDALTLDIDDVARSIPADKVTAARTIFTWEKGVKPGKPTKKKVS